MSLVAGTRLGPYEIQSALGAGGMGEVYKARDTRLDRTVAIKVLPELFAADPERVARFAREARMLAAVNHPHIAQVHGLEEWRGKSALVMELVEGPTLADLIASGPLPVNETLAIAKQIAEALEAAHELGIIHRDLKPANVKVREDGTVKVLDFGLAKVLDPATCGESAALDNSPTLASPTGMTTPGVILGTAAYMAPEQAKGRGVDRRADIWAFGCVLYECLTGTKAFQGETLTETLAAILRGEPDWTLLPSAAPARLTDLVRKCLRKESTARLRDIGDARVEIGEAIQEAAVPVDRPRPGKEIRWNSKLVAILVVGGATVGALLGSSLAQRLSRPSASYPRAVVRVAIDTEPAKQIGDWTDEGVRPSRTALALSPDGRWLVYWGVANQGVQLFRRDMASGRAEAVAGGEGGRDPFFSPDSQHIGFWSNGSLKKVPTGGGTPVSLCEIPEPWGATWASTQDIYYSSNSGLWKVSADGGLPVALTRRDPYKGEFGQTLPYALPAGDVLLFVARTSVNPWDNPRIEALSLKTGGRKVLVAEGADPRYVPTGHLVFVRRGTLLAAPFDVRRLEVGTPVPLIEGVMQSMSEHMENAADGRNTSQVGGYQSPTYAAQFTISESGSLAYVGSDVAPGVDHWLVWVDPQKGSIEPVISESGAYFAPRLSPDGRQIAYATKARERQIWVCDIDRGTTRPVVSRGSNSWPVWSHDGKRLAWVSQRSDGSDVLWAPIGDPGAEPDVLIRDATVACSWSPAGDLLAFVRGSGIWILHLKDRRQEQFLVEPQYRVSQPAFSPDGRYLAYTSDQAGGSDVFVRPYPGPGEEARVSVNGGSSPVWSADGRELFYLSGPRSTDLMSVNVSLGTGFSFGKPRLVADYWGVGLASVFGVAYDIDARSRRFVAVSQTFGGRPVRYSDVGENGRAWLGQKLKSDSGRKLTAGLESWLEQRPATRINLVLDWPEEIRRKTHEPSK